MKNSRWFKFALLTVTLMCVKAWASEDQGINDYAKAYWNPGKSCVPFVRKFESVCGANFPDDSDKDYDTRAKPNTCGNHSMDERAAVRKGHIVEVHLTQVFIKDFLERGEAFFGKKRGEIAIVARVAELDDKNDFDFSAAGRDRGRLVYYSEGVEPGQFLNFSQLPVYGPIEYKGKPLVMEFYIMELDVKENTEISGLLSAAAGLGAVAYPPASPVLKVLDTIGSGLLKANKSDLQFKYHAALLAGDQQMQALRSGSIEFGNYAFVRMPFVSEASPTGAATHRWNRWYFNQKNGRLYEDSICSDPLLKHTYLTVQINRAKEETSLDPANTLAAFMVKLANEASTSTAQKVAIIGALKESLESDKKYRDAKTLIAFAHDMRWPDGTMANKQPLDAGTKAAIKTLGDQVVSSIKFARNPGPNGKAEFDEHHASLLVDALSRLVGTKRYSDQTLEVTDLMANL